MLPIHEYLLQYSEITYACVESPAIEIVLQDCMYTGQIKVLCYNFNINSLLIDVLKNQNT